MSSPDKCPHCGANDKGPLDSLGGFECGSVGSFQSPMCRERTARIKAETELASTKRELEETKTVLGAWQRSFGSLQLTHATAALDAYKSKANRCEDEMNRQAARANAAEARVRELEGLPVLAIEPTDVGMARMMIEVPMPQRHVTARTLGEAMGGSK